MKDRIEEYILRLVERSTPERTAWNLEKLREGKPATWNYIDGCMLTALLSLTEITGDSRYAAFAEQVTDHFVREDGEILTFAPEKQQLDDFNEGRVLFPVYRMTGKEKYRRAAEMLHTERGSALRKQRSVDVETIFGDIKRNWGFRRFLLRGLEKVGHEMRMVAMGHNIRKMAYALAV